MLKNLSLRNNQFSKYLFKFYSWIKWTFITQNLNQCLKEPNLFSDMYNEKILFYFWFNFCFYFDILHLEPNTYNLREKKPSVYCLLTVLYD